MPDAVLVTRSQERAWGAAVFAGTRVPVETLSTTSKPARPSMSSSGSSPR